MTEAVSPPPATERACPRCGAALAADQEWCLNCGAAVGARVAPTPRWRGPVAIVGVLLALVCAALVLALVELSGDPQPVAKATPTPAATAPAATPAATPEATITPAPTPEGAVSPEDQPGGAGDESLSPLETPDVGTGTGTAPGTAEWPAGRTAWTVILASTRSKADAARKAKAAAKGGQPVGVLQSDEYSSLRKGFWVVFQGQHDSRQAAQDAAEQAGGEAYARRVVPR
jgi:RNA polymerase subunit RPABC4/transcription elongation factor Spt4